MSGLRHNLDLETPIRIQRSGKTGTAVMDAPMEHPSFVGMKRAGPGVVKCDICNITFESRRHAMARHASSIRHQQNLKVSELMR